MSHRAAFLAVVLSALASATFASDARRPWQWNDGERLAERSNATAAARRAAGRRAAEPHVYDVIDGSDHPQLFFEFELFDQMVRLAYADDARTREAYRDSKETVRRSIGLPPDFWERVGAIAAAYRQDRLDERRLGLAAAQHETEQNAVSARLCRDRFAVLVTLRQEFPRFSEFLYTAVAPSVSMTILSSSEPELRRIVAGECQ